MMFLEMLRNDVLIKGRTDRAERGSIRGGGMEPEDVGDVARDASDDVLLAQIQNAPSSVFWSWDTAALHKRRQGSSLIGRPDAQGHAQPSSVRGRPHCARL